MTWFEGFDTGEYSVNGIRVFARTGGRPSGPPVLMLHGFPQSHVMWHRVARRLMARFFLVLADLRGYGDSSKPPGAADHSNYSKRTMASDMVGLMRSLGHERFGLVGHDRGARVSHRLAIDHPQAVDKLCLIDIAPTLDMYAGTDMRFASLYYHWFHLIQPSPLPERMIGADARFYLHWKLGGWGAKGTSYIESEALAEYERCFCTPEAVHATCEDYRASAGIDLDDDRASRTAGEKIACDTLMLWGERGVVHRVFQPVALWQAQCSRTLRSQLMPAGHFIPEELPEETAEALLEFL